MVFLSVILVQENGKFNKMGFSQPLSFASAVKQSILKDLSKVVRQVHSTCLHLIHLWGLPWALFLKSAR